MKQSTVRRLVNLALALMLCSLLWLGWRQPGLAPRTSTTLTDLNPDQVSTIRLTGPEAADLELRRGAQGWQLKAPAELPVNPEQMHDLLSIAKAQTFASYDAARADLGALGLTPAMTTLWLDEVSIGFGDRAPVEGYRYVRTGQHLDLISNAHFHTVNQNLAAFVSPRLLPQDWRLSGIRLPDALLQRSMGGDWEASGGMTLSSSQARSLAERWQEATAAAVQRWMPGLATVARLALISRDSDQELIFDVEKLDNAPDFILARPKLGLRYHFSPHTGALLMGKPGATIDAEPTAANP